MEKFFVFFLLLVTAAGEATSIDANKSKYNDNKYNLQSLEREEHYVYAFCLESKSMDLVPPVQLLV